MKIGKFLITELREVIFNLQVFGSWNDHPLADLPEELRNKIVKKWERHQYDAQLLLSGTPLIEVFEMEELKQAA